MRFGNRFGLQWWKKKTTLFSDGLFLLTEDGMSLMTEDGMYITTEYGDSIVNLLSLEDGSGKLLTEDGMGIY